MNKLLFAVFLFSVSLFVRPLRAQAPPPPNIYGAGMQAFADGLENLRIPVDEPYQDNRFIAETSSTLHTIRLWMKAGSGYSGGNGGTIRLQLETDDGTGNHFPSGTILGTTSASPGNSSTVGFLFTFSSPPSLTAGRVSITLSFLTSTAVRIRTTSSTDNMADSD